MKNPWHRFIGPNLVVALGVVLLFALAVLHPEGKAAALVAGLTAAGLIWLPFMPMTWLIALPLAARMWDVRHGFGPRVWLCYDAVASTHRVTGWGPWVFWLLTGL